MVRFRVQVYYASKGETLFKNVKIVTIMLEEFVMKVKRAIITVELVDESRENPNGKIVQEMIKWFREDAISAPWIKEIKKVVVQEA